MVSRNVLAIAVLGMVLCGGFISQAEAAPLSATAKASVLKALSTWTTTISSSAKGASCATVGPKMASLFAPNGILIPTIDNTIRNTKPSIQAFFQTILCPKKPTVSIKSSIVNALSATSFTVSGSYVFSFPGGPPFTARYTYVYEVIGGKYLIQTQHASKNPV